MPIPKRAPDVDVTLVGGPEEGLVLTIPAHTSEIGRWDENRALHRYAVQEASGTATLIPE